MLNGGKFVISVDAAQETRGGVLRNESSAQDIILAPVITENSHGWHRDQEVHLQGCHQTPTRSTIAQAVEELFGVKVAKVNTINVRGRYPPPGHAHAGYTAASKKAIVTLTKDSKGIEFFDMHGLRAHMPAARRI